LKTNGLPRLLILEFAPHLLLEGKGHLPPTPTTLAEWVAWYRSRIAVAEDFISGFVMEALGMADRPVLDTATLKGIGTVFRQPDKATEVFWRLRGGRFGYGQRRQPDGQVQYVGFLPNASAAAFLGDTRSELGAYDTIYLARPYRPEAWQALQDLIRLRSDSTEVVVIRAPTGADVYALENARHGERIRMVEDFVKSLGAVYLDLNPHPYHSVDHSHIDGYDTGRLAHQLAGLLAHSPIWRPISGKVTCLD
jgi:hypothetical protein